MQQRKQKKFWHLSKYLFKPKNIYESLLPVYYVTHLFGLAPYKQIKIIDNNGQTTLQYRKKNVNFWDVLKITIIIGPTTYLCYQEIRYALSTGINLIKITDIYEYVSNLFLLTVGLIMAQVQQGEIVNVINTIAEINVILNNIGKIYLRILSKSSHK